MSRVQAQAEEMMARHGFMGVPVGTFEQAGREQLIALLNEELNPESKVLEIGCGCLRIAYWLVRFLDAGCYYGIEPARQQVEYGLQFLFTSEEVRLKQPRFDFNANFDSSVFGAKFDFFLARSIWTHACKRQIEATLDSFIRDSTAGGIFLTSYLPAQSAEDDYQGDHWVGTSHESDTPGVIRHSLVWIVQQCEKRGLQLDELPGIDCDSQYWLRIRRR
ncbi:MAG TPA: class I SAM-dependent methyltransferase [Bryobacteraceae bacterium]